MKYAIFLVVVLGLVAIGTSDSFATAGTSSGDPIYMKYGTINGGVTESTHTNWIALNSFQFGVERPISALAGTSEREPGAPVVSDITITKVMDSSSTALFSEAFQGTPQTVTIDLVKTDGTGQAVTYAEYVLSNALVSSYSVSSGGDNPTESIAISFTKITFKFTPQNPDGSVGTPTPPVGWDLALNRAA